MYLSSADFARKIGVATSTVQRWDANGSLKPVKRTMHGKRLYSEEQLQAYLNEDYDNPILKGKKKEE